MTEGGLNAGDLVAFTVTRDGPVVRVTAAYGGTEGYGAANVLGMLSVDVAFRSAVADLNRKLERSAADYRSEWATLADRSPRDVYTPDALRGGDMTDCDHDWVPWSGKQRCRKCGQTQG